MTNREIARNITEKLFTHGLVVTSTKMLEEVLNEKDKEIQDYREVLQMFLDHLDNLPDDTLLGTGLTNKPFLEARRIMGKNK